MGSDAGLFHQQFQLVDHILLHNPLPLATQSGIIPADDLLAGGRPHHLIVDDALAGHVHPHIGGGFIRTGAHDLFKHGCQDGEDLHIPVVVDGGGAVSLQMERVDHIHVVQISSGRLVCEVDGVLQGKIPDGEGFKLGIAGLDAPFVVVIQLGQAGGHFTAARSGCGDHHQFPGGFDVFIAAIALVADDMSNVGGIAFNGIMVINLDAQRLEPLFKCVGHRLPLIAGEHHTAYVQADGAEFIHQPQNIQIIGDAQVAPQLIFFNIASIDDNDHFHLMPQLEQHPQLAIGLEAGQHAGGMIIVKQLTAEFQIQFTAELRDPVTDMLGLHAQVLVVIKPDFVCHDPIPLPLHLFSCYYTGFPFRFQGKRGNAGILPKKGQKPDILPFWAPVVFLSYVCYHMGKTGPAGLAGYVSQNRKDFRRLL